jgi:chemotaxis protein CheY-P-specific phosphatase CheC
MMMNLKQAISNVLETMFFLPVQIIDDGSILDNWSQQNTKFWHVTVQFSGPIQGTFFLLAPVQLAREITANFLGLSGSEVESVQEADTVKEALNMIGGYVLSQIEKADAYQLGIPEIVAAEDTDPTALQVEPENLVLMETDENHLAVGLRLN